MTTAETPPRPALPKAALMRACADAWEGWAAAAAARGDAPTAEYWRC